MIGVGRERDSVSRCSTMADCHRLIRPFESAGAPHLLPARNLFYSLAPKYGCNNPRPVSSCLPSCLHIGNSRSSAGSSLSLRSGAAREASKSGEHRHIVVTINQVTVGRRDRLFVDTLVSQSNRDNNRPASQRRRQRSGLKRQHPFAIGRSPFGKQQNICFCFSFWLISLTASGMRPFFWRLIKTVPQSVVH